MKLDICAPQVIFPDDFQSGDPMLVVVDLGRILLTNSQGKILLHLNYTFLNVSAVSLPNVVSKSACFHSFFLR